MGGYTMGPTTQPHQQVLVSSVAWEDGQIFSLSRVGLDPQAMEASCARALSPKQRQRSPAVRLPPRGQFQLQPLSRPRRSSGALSAAFFSTPPGAHA